MIEQPFVQWLILLAAAVAVVGAVFAQSSTTIISRQLTEHGEDNSRHGRLGTALSVFQDVTAVPFVIVIPVRGMSAGVEGTRRVAGLGAREGGPRVRAGLPGGPLVGALCLLVVKTVLVAGLVKFSDIDALTA